VLSPLWYGNHATIFQFNQYLDLQKTANQISIQEEPAEKKRKGTPFLKYLFSITSETN
jgi:hypothetical protein